MANTNSYVESIMTNQLEKLCLEGNFPKVNFKHEGGFKSYSLYEWIQLHARFAKLVHDKLVEAGYEQGVFSTRLRSDVFKNKAKEIVLSITVEQIKASNGRFKTWID